MWIGLEELADAAMQGGGKLLLIRTRAQHAFFVWITDEGGLDQNRRHIGCLEDRERSLFSLRLMQAIDVLELIQHGVG